MICILNPHPTERGVSRLACKISLENGHTVLVRTKNQQEFLLTIDKAVPVDSGPESTIYEVTFKESGGTLDPSWSCMKISDDDTHVYEAMLKADRYPFFKNTFNGYFLTVFTGAGRLSWSGTVTRMSEIDGE